MRDNLARVSGPGDYLATHWRGGFGLGFAYWINGVAVGLIVFAVTLAVGYLIQTRGIALGITTIRLLIALIVIGGLVVTAWQAVGIWRSASAHVGRGGRQVWAILAKVAVVFGVLRTAAEFVRDAPSLAVIFG
ncbi:hypothetical protein [Elioraea rosea]|uniref:hypothetical protein n=1 Tax=Elioraea rosea TaxID=2492390 RepID=UPI00118447DE|nr:hypothetical protein [Elioraea rosea]